MRIHEIITGWLHFIAALFVFGLVAIFWCLAAQIASLFADTFIPELFAMYGIPIAVILLAASRLEIAASIALISRNVGPHAWARPVLIWVSAVQLLIFPIGTAIAIYTIWAFQVLKPDAPALPTSGV